MDTIRDWGDTVLDAANDFFTEVAEFLPNLIGGLLLFILGLIVAKLLAGAVDKLLGMVGFDRLGKNRAVKDAMDSAGLKVSLTEVVSRIVYWVVVLVFLMAVANVLGLQAMEETLTSLVGYVPNVVAAVIVLALTIAAARLIRDVVAAGLSQFQASFTRTVSRIAEWTIIVFGGIIAISQLGFDTTVLTANVTLIVGGVVLAFALSFGLGAKGVVGNLVAGYYTQQQFSVGDEVVVGDVKGKVTSLNATNVVVKTKDGSVVVPNNQLVG